MAQVPAAASGGLQEETVTLNFPEEMQIQALADYIGQRLKINILYDDEIGDKRLFVRAATDVPVSSLLAVLESALKMKGLALVDTNAEGWKKIVTVEQLANVAPSGDAAEAIRQFGKGTAVTQTFVLKNADPTKADELIKPFLTQPGSNSVPLPESKILIVTDYATNLLRIAEWIEHIDKPREAVAVEFLEVRHAKAEDLATQVTTILTAKVRSQGATEATSDVEVVADERTNQILLIGPPDDVDTAKQYLESLDRPLSLTTKTYTFVNVRASTIDQLARQLMSSSEDDRLYRSVVDEDANMLVVTAPEETQVRIEELRKARDVAPEAVESPIRFYKIKNLHVTELLDTIRSIENEAQVGTSRHADWSRLPTDGRIRPARERPVPGPNQLPGPAGGQAPLPPAMEPPKTVPDDVSKADAGGMESPGAALLLGHARVTADIHMNTLVVVAEPRVHRLYAELIEELDQPRPQVMIEATFVIIDTSDDFSLGVEVSGGDGVGAKRLFAFSSYGLSTVDPVSGALSLLPGLGFNGTLVDPDVADVVIRALSRQTRARVTSAPKILVNDNATGQLTSVQEVPFTSINASQTVATTSFAGFADAGTTITVTPRVRDDNSLQLDFAITVNAFTGTGSAGVPPPRQTEEVTSQITIPDGHTVIVGGLSSGTRSYSYTGIPFVERIPLIREVTGLTSTGKTSSSMFIFLRPIILREDKFRDLKFLSDRDAGRACLRTGAPSSTPVWMR
jgi:type II secretory pathway component GspD/PulD (secretin)